MLIMSGSLNVFLVMSLRGALKDMKELAREGLLASTAQSADDLVSASLTAHQAALEREQPIDKKVKQAGVVNIDPKIPHLVGRDGHQLFPLKPLG